MKPVYWGLGLVAIAALALALRLHGIVNPIMDHPGWRQGDTAAIARNFALLRFDPLYPQTTYNGPAPNYVELELQIVPFLAAIAYKIAGVHVIVGRLLSIAFSIATVVTLGFFARCLFRSASAGLIAAFCYAVFPGGVYYGRTFMPDCAMTFFLTAALFSAYVLFRLEPRITAKTTALTTLLFALAFLAKPVAVLAVVPLAVLIAQRARDDRFAIAPSAIVTLVPLLVLWLYDRDVAAHAEWHWASGITWLHVLPALTAAFSSGGAFLAKCTQFRIVLGMFRETMLGTIAFWCTILAFVVSAVTALARGRGCYGAGSPADSSTFSSWSRSNAWITTCSRYCRSARWSSADSRAAYIRFVRRVDAAPTARNALLSLVPVLALALFLAARAPVEAYYGYNVEAYRAALLLDGSIPSDALLVIGHYGPDLQYYMNRFGWEEIPYSGCCSTKRAQLRKGARYFVAVERTRLNHNLELCAYLQRFNALRWSGPWTVYVTDPKNVPARMNFWRAFRTAERTGHGRDYLDRSGMRCHRRIRRAGPLPIGKQTSEGFGTNGDAAAKWIIERDRQEKHEADRDAQSADHKLLHDGALETEQIGERDGHISAGDQNDPHDAIDSHEVDGEARLTVHERGIHGAQHCGLNSRQPLRRYRKIAHFAVGAFEQWVWTFNAIAATHLNPFFIDDRVHVGVQRAAKAGAPRKGVGIAIDRCYLASLVVTASLCSGEPFPHADRNESQEYRIHDADDGENEACAIVVRRSYLARGAARHDKTHCQRGDHEAADDRQAGQPGGQGFDPRDHGSGNNDAAPNMVVWAGASGAPDETN